jgi:hypothetical protein
MLLTVNTYPPSVQMYKLLTILNTNREYLPTALVKWSFFVVGMEDFLCQNAAEFFM